MLKSKSAMELSKLSLLPFLLLAAVASSVAGDELRTFIVHVHPQESLAFETAEDRTAWYEQFLPEDGRLRHAYHHVASGFAARLTQRELDDISAMPGFVSAIPDQKYTLQTTHTPQFLGLNAPLPGAWTNDTSLRGSGVIVGMLDTGVFPHHASFSDRGMPPPPAKWKGHCYFNGTACNNKLIGARDFTTGNNTAAPPVDDVGHGTHTASTAAGAVAPGAQVLGQAAGAASGVAPRAHLAVYKVCDDTGCSGADILAGIDAAVGDGCDVISMSLGGPSRPFYIDPIAIGTFGAVEKGVFVSMAAGNSGPEASTLSNEAPWMLTVAASTMDRSIRATVRLGNGLYFHGQSTYQPTDSAPAFRPLVYAGASGKPFAQFCDSGDLDGLDVRGKIVVCELGGEVPRVFKGQVVQKAGGAGMILVNQYPQGYDTLADAHVLPASHVDYAAGSAIKLYINSTTSPTARIVFHGTVLGASPAPSIVFFSSRGPNQQDAGILKPDVTGPGVNVLAAWPFPVGPPSSSPPLPGTTYNIISGTSMSTPHLSGVAAFVKSKHPDWSPAAIKSAIMTTADVDDRAGTPLLDEQHSVASFFATGAGHVNPVKATNPGLVYDIAPSDYISYLCGKYTNQQVSVIARRPVNCSAIVTIPGRLLNYPSISITFPTAMNSTMPVIVRRTVKNVAEVPTSYYAAVDMQESLVSVVIYPDRLDFTEPNQEKSFRVIVWPKQRNLRLVQGALRWVSDTHAVRSPISVTFA
ncbi:hypothetical protein QOZ80_4AG0307670 [Eleusine coracana subsp. coracana]|nr:hypothetical protein QOZ80_4AG0307670 [Eleusine coracana subsp. coracana]